jgi:hypothetical protein
MGMFDKPKIGQELLDVPMGDMIQQMAFAIAEAQRKLDENSIETAQMMGGLETIVDENTGDVTFADSRVFFGKEKFILADAIAAHNQTGDMALRANIRQGLGSNFTETNLVNLDGVTGITTADELSDFTETTTGAATDNLHDSSKIYKIDVGTNEFEYYRYTGPIPAPSTNRVYQQVSRYATTIEKVSTLADSTVFLVPSRVSMLELGFSPTFYQFVDTIIEVKISIKYTQDGSQTSSSAAAQVNTSNNHSGLRGLLFGGKRRSTVTTAHVNAAYAQKFSYSAEGSSLLRTKLVPIPPPAILEERIRLQMEILREQSAS